VDRVDRVEGEPAGAMAGATADAMADAMEQAVCEQPRRTRRLVRVTVLVEVDCADGLPFERVGWLAAAAVAPCLGGKARCLDAVARPTRVFVAGAEHAWQEPERFRPVAVIDG
jgi:hypothetical protein